MEFDTLIFLGFIAGSLYIIILIAKHNSKKELYRFSSDHYKLSMRFIFGGLIGLVTGIVSGIFANPLTVPWDTPGDVSGLTIASWLFWGIAGLFVGSFASLILPKRKNK